MSHVSPAHSASILILLLVAGAPASAQEAMRVEPIVVSGEAAPDLPGATFAQVDATWVNREGGVAFWARLTGPGLTPLTDQTAWVAGDNGLLLLARAGQPLGLPLQEQTPSAFAQVALLDDGTAVLLANMDDGTLPYADASRRAVLFETNGLAPPRLIAAEEMMMFQDHVDRAAVSNEGVVAFHGWTFRDGELSRWLPTYTEPAGWVDVEGRPFAAWRSDAPAVGRNGDVVFRATMEDAVGRGDTVNALLRHVATDRAEPLLLFRGEATSPFASVSFADVSSEFIVGPQGALVIRGRLREEHGGRSGVWMVTDAGASPLVQEGDAIPGSPTDTFGSIVDGPAMNLHGDLAIQALVEPAAAGEPSRPGIWCFPEGDGAWEVARAGSPVPGLDGASYVHLAQPTVTDAGRIVFVAGVAGDAIGEFTQTALIVRSRDGGATVLARTGAEMELNGVAGVIRSVSFAGGNRPDGQRQVHSHAAADEIVFHVLLEDGRSGLVRATVGHGADLDHNGVIDLWDLMQYVDLWFTGSGRAEIEAPPHVDVFDLLAFLDCWFAGIGGGACP